MKLLVLSDLHVGLSKESSSHPGIIRQANSQALQKLSDLIPKFNSESFDLVIQLGDLIRDLHEEADSVNLEMVLKVLNTIKAPIINIPGNHDLKSFGKTDLINRLRLAGLNSELYGVKTYGNIQLIWLGIEFDQNGRVIIPREQFDEIDKKLTRDSEKIVFSHYALSVKETTGNFYFDNIESETRYSNILEIKDFLMKNSVHFAINGHEHWCNIKIEDHINYISLPSFSENLLISADANVNPGVYSIMNINNGKVIINSYSGDYSFFHLEL